MCGIAGLVARGAVDPDLLAKMAGRIAHRGPDDQGIWIDGATGVGLANRRLAIIDLSPQGHQPMVSADGRWVLTFNGEIYNHVELRAFLEERGAVPDGGWRGHSDTETLLQAIAVLGVEAAIERSVGMFALALWDRAERVLTLARDRMGEKPLYYGWCGGDFLFASELKAMRVHPAFDAPIDRRAIAAFASRGYIPAPLSIYEGISKLPPGCMLTMRRDVAPVVERYWSSTDVLRAGLADPIEDERDATDQLEQALARAVTSQSLADVPVGAFLSGGIDSSTVVALYQKHSPATVRTFTIGFNEREYDESADARAVAAHLGTDHHERIVTAAEARDVIPQLPAIYDEPFADASQIPTFLVSRFAREQVTVALSGDGGDELFGGYTRHSELARLWSGLGRIPGPLRSAATGALAAVPPPLWDKLGAVMRGRASPNFGGKVRKTLRAARGSRDFDIFLQRFLDEWDGEGSPVIGGERPILPKPTGSQLPPALHMMAADIGSYLPDDVLCKVDRASMAVSLEVHAPFLDHRVVELSARIPVRFKIAGGQGKRILRGLLFRHAPESLFDRPKAGFAVPVGTWLRGPLRQWAEELIDPRSLRSDGWFNSDMIQRKWRDHVQGKQDCAGALWPILMFQAWLRHQG